MSSNPYRRTYLKFWRDEKVQALVDPLDKLLAFYIFTSQQSNRVGIFYFSPWMAIDDTHLPAEGIMERVESVCQHMNWHWDAATKVIYIPTWWKHNPPANRDALVGALKCLDDVPGSPFLPMFYENVTYLEPYLHDILATRAAGGVLHGVRHGVRHSVKNGVRHGANPTRHQTTDNRKKKQQPSPTLDNASEEPADGSSSNGHRGETPSKPNNEPHTPAASPPAWPSPEALVALYHALVPRRHPRVTMLSPKRQTRCREYLLRFPDEAFWRRAFGAVAGSLFLQGQKPSPGHEHFVADFDWFLQGAKTGGVENCVKAAEGKYKPDVLLEDDDDAA